MSRTAQSEILENPATKFMKWKTIKEIVTIDGDEMEKIKGGAFTYYDKASETNINYEIPFTFAILNKDLVSIKGYDEKNKQGVWSNEVSKPEHIITLRNKTSKLMTFKKSDYKLNKDKAAGFGGKWTNSCYIAIKLKDGSFEIANLQLSGAPLTGANDMESKNPDEVQDGWMNFTNFNKKTLYSNFIEVSGFKPKKKGTSKFTIPVFKIGDVISPEDSRDLNELDEELTRFLDYYFSNKTEKEPEKEVEGLDY